jgi:hypothetical protein
VPEIRIEITVADNRRDLVPAAEGAWESFNVTVRNPLTVTSVICAAADIACNGDAFSKPFYGRVLGEWAQFILSVPLLTTITETDRNNTLLHECIHMDFAFGEHRERWQRLQEQVRAVESTIRSMMTTDIDLLTFLDYRHRVACLIRNVPDEIVAEQRLKRDYPERWPDRAAQYVRMRQRHEIKVLAGRPGDCLWPFSVSYELLRNAFFIPIADGMPAVQEELQRLESVADTQLRVCADGELVAFLLGEKPALLDVSHDRPFPAAEAAYDRVFDRIMAVDRA